MYCQEKLEVVEFGHSCPCHDHNSGEVSPMAGNNPQPPWRPWPRPPATKPPPLKRFNIEYGRDDETDSASGSRHTRSSGVNASIRRARDAERLRASSDAAQSNSSEAPSDADETPDDPDDAPVYPELEIAAAEQHILDAMEEVGQHQRRSRYFRVDYESRGLQIDFQIRPSPSGSIGVHVDIGASSGVHVSRGKRGRFHRAEPSVRVESDDERPEPSVPRPGARSTKTGKEKDMTWLVQGEMPGGPSDGRVIPSLGGHIAACIWKGTIHEREVLRTYNRGTTFKELQRWRDSLTGEAREVVYRSGLSHLQDIMMPHIDSPLISAFVERWQPDTNTFHMPFGEMTILLHDVVAILRVPIDGHMVSSTGKVHDDSQTDLHQHFCELLQMTMDELLATPKAMWDNGGVSTARILDACWKKKKRAPDVEACAFLLTVLGTTLFADKSGNRILPANILELRRDLRGVDKYSWGSATLAYLYRQLGLASRSGCTGIAGCLTLLQAWIYEYFPCFRPQKGCLAISPGDARAAMWDSGKPSNDFHLLQSYRLRIDQLTPREVNWLPYGPHPETLGERTLIPGWVGYRDILEPYLPDRVVRQFGYIQGVPDPIPVPEKVRRPPSVKSYELVFSRPFVLSHWNNTSSLKILNFKDVPRIDLPEAASLGPLWCTEDYMDWYETYSHPRVTPDDALLSSDRAVSRAKTDYWVNYATECMRGMMSITANKNCPEYLRCEKFLCDWQNSEGS